MGTESKEPKRETGSTVAHASCHMCARCRGAKVAGENCMSHHKKNLKNLSSWAYLMTDPSKQTGEMCRVEEVNNRDPAML
jgi:hypothetical protein